MKFMDFGMWISDFGMQFSQLIDNQSITKNRFRNPECGFRISECNFHNQLIINQLPNTHSEIRNPHSEIE
jgi:hypothetical protein